jgi:hypothetical protein
MAVNATIKNSIIAGLSQIVADTAVAVTYADHAYTAGHGVISAEKRTDASGGPLDGYSDTYTIMQAALTANGDNPAAGQVLTTPDGIKRILRVRKDAFAACVRLDVGDRY